MKNDVVENEILKIGFKKSYKGYKYLKQIIELIHEEDLIYDFNLKYCYSVIAKRYRVKQSAVKGDINYLISVVISNDYYKKKLLDYTGYTEVSDISVKRLVEAVVSKLYL